MKGSDLIKAMGYIDDELAAEAIAAEVQREETVREEQFGAGAAKRAKLWQRPAAIRRTALVACLAIAFFAGRNMMLSNQADAPFEASAPTESVTNYGMGYKTELQSDAALPEVANDGAFEPQAQDNKASEILSPDNGDYDFEAPLREAMAAYEDSIVYPVGVTVFSDGVPLAADDPTRKELLSQHFGGAEEGADGVIHLDYAQLTEFQPDDAHGYRFRLLAAP